MLLRGKRAERRSAAPPSILGRAVHNQHRSFGIKQAMRGYEAANLRSIVSNTAHVISGPKVTLPHFAKSRQVKSEWPRQVNTNAVKSHKSTMSPPLLQYLRYPDAAPFPAAHSHGRRQIPPASTVIGLRGASCQRPPRHPVSAVGPRQWPWRRIVHAVDRPRGWHGRAGEQVRHERPKPTGSLIVRVL